MPPLKAEETRLLFRNIDEPKLSSIRTYRRFGGYQAIRKAYKDLVKAATPKSQLDAAAAAAAASGKVPAYMTNQISNYQAALERLTGGDSSSSSSSGATGIASLFG